MSRKPYETDLTDREWEIIEPLIPVPKPGGPTSSEYTKDYEYLPETEEAFIYSASLHTLLRRLT
ncbi:transposase [Nostoc mirabile]|uniref:transposase n=1 Tax=Nostoc mirabile TaxID=2907820 RepID=UPI0035582B56